MKENVLKTVEALIERAVKTNNENEARNAALQACKLIHAHGLLGGRPRAQGFYAPPATTWRIEDFFDDLLGNERPPSPAAPPPQPTVQPPASSNPSTDPAARLIPVMEPAWCAACGQRILRGKFAYWSRKNLYHQNCWKKEP